MRASALLVALVFTAASTLADARPSTAANGDAGPAQPIPAAAQSVVTTSTADASPGQAELPASDTTAPSTPTGLTASAAGSTRIDLTWTTATDDVGVQGYRVYRDGSLVTAIGVVGSTSISDLGLAPGATYAYTISAIDGAGNESVQTTPVEASTPPLDTTAPTVPTTLSGAATAWNSVALSWAAASDSSGVTSYVVYRDGVRLATVNGPETSFTDRSTAPLTAYSYSVRAVDASGNTSAASAAAGISTPAGTPLADTTTPSVPTGLTATGVSASRVDLVWSAAADASGVQGYKIYRNGTYQASIGIVGSTSFSVTGLPQGTTYTFKVAAVDGRGNESARSAGADATTVAVDLLAPSVPSAVTATASGSIVTVSWAASSDAVGVTRYTVLRGGTAIGIVAPVTGTTQTFIDRTVAPSTTYGYTVQASDAAENTSASSGSASVTTPAIETVRLRPTADVDNAGFTPKSGTALWSQLSETASDGNTTWIAGPTPGSATATLAMGGAPAGDVTRVVVHYSARQYVASGSPTTMTVRADLYDGATLLGIGTARSPGTSYTDYSETFEGLSVSSSSTLRVKLTAGPGTATTTIRVTYLDLDAEGGGASTADTNPPSVPTGVTATVLAGSQVKLTWTASTDDDGVQGYYVYHLNNQVGTLAVNGTTFIDTGLTPGTTYTYKVRAIDGAGNASAKTDGLEVSTPGDSTPPTVPGGASATAVAWNHVQLTWSASSDASGVTRYAISRNGAALAVVAGTVTSFADRSVDQATAYGYTVAAIDEAGNASAASAVASVTTPAYVPPADTTPPSVPGGLTATAAGSDRVDLSWTAATDDRAVQGYRLYRDGVYLATVGVIGSTFFSDTGLAPGTTYSYAVRALDGAGNESPPSGAATATTDALDTTAPSVPTGLGASAAAWNQVALTWTASSDANGVNRYAIFRGGSPLAVVAGSVTAFTDRSTDGATTYSYTVSALDAAGNVSGPSAAADVTTPAAPDTETFVAITAWTDPLTPANRAAASISGTAEPGATIALTVSDGTPAHDVTAATTADGTGAWSSGPLDLSGLDPAPAPVTYTVVATDAASNTATDSKTASQTSGSGGTPIVSLTAPAATVFATETLQAAASYAGGIARVEFLVDGQLVGSDTSAPYTFEWDTTTITDGAHLVAARAVGTDAATATSDAVTVSVANALSADARVEADFDAGRLMLNDRARYGVYAVGAPLELPERYRAGGYGSQPSEAAVSFLADWNSLDPATQAEITTFLQQPRRGSFYGSMDDPGGGPGALSAGNASCRPVFRIDTFGFVPVPSYATERTLTTTNFEILYYTWGDGTYADDVVSGLDNVATDTFSPCPEPGTPPVCNGIPDYIDKVAQGLKTAHAIYAGELGYNAVTVRSPVAIHNVVGGQVMPNLHDLGDSSKPETIEISNDDDRPYYLAHHELFHVFQQRYVNDLSLLPSWWWLEASAQWAAGYVARSGVNGDESEYHRSLRVFFDRPNEHLTQSDRFPFGNCGASGCREYGEFVLPEYIAEQHSPNAIRAIFEHMNGQGSPAIQQVVPAIASVADLSSLISDFAWANYTLTYGVGADLPEWRDGLAAFGTSTAADEVGPARPRRTSVPIAVGETKTGSATLAPGGAVYIDLIPSGLGSAQGVLSVMVSGPVNIPTGARLVTLTYPTSGAEPCEQVEIDPQLLGGDTREVWVGGDCQYAVLVLTGNDVLGGQTSPVTWSATLQVPCGDAGIGLDALGGYVTSSASGATVPPFPENPQSPQGYVYHAAAVPVTPIMTFLSNAAPSGVGQTTFKGTPNDAATWGLNSTVQQDFDMTTARWAWDLGEPTRICSVVIGASSLNPAPVYDGHPFGFPAPLSTYRLTVKASDDGASWTEVVSPEQLYAGLLPQSFDSWAQAFILPEDQLHRYWAIEWEAKLGGGGFSGLHFFPGLDLAGFSLHRQLP